MSETLFIGLYAVTGAERCPTGMVDPYNRKDVSRLYLYDLEHVDRFSLYEDRLVIDWGRARSWAQYADRNPKPIESIHERAHQPLPGPSAFRIAIRRGTRCPRELA